MNTLPLRSTFIRFITNDLPDTEDHALIQRIKALNLVGFLLICAVFVLGLVAYFIKGNTTFGIMQFLSAGAGLVYLAIQRNMPPAFSLHGGIATLISVIFLLTLPDGIASSHTFWLYLIPVYSFYLTGVRGGLWWSGVTFAIAVIYMSLPYLGLHEQPVDIQFVLDFSLSFMVIIFFAFWYEHSRTQYLSELSSKNQELERLIYTVSHDLKTPVVSLLGYIEFIKEEIQTGDTQKRDEDINKLQQITLNMRQMINDLLNLSRVKKTGEYQNVSTGDLVVKLLTEAEPQIEEKHITVHMEGRFPTILADPRKLEEIFRNLISNAIKYIGNPPEPTITVGVREHKDGYRFFVRDNGIGIKKSELTNIFKPFYSKSDISIGSGIGLSIVKGFVEDMAGKVWVESQENRGSTFWFSLPHGHTP